MQGWSSSILKLVFQQELYREDGVHLLDLGLDMFIGFSYSLQFKLEFCYQLLIAKFKLKLKRVGKTTGLLRYNLNQIPYEYTVEVKNRFKELDLVDKVPEELWIEARNIVQEAATKTIPKKRKCKKAKWLSNEALQIAEKVEKMQGR